MTPLLIRLAINLHRHHSQLALHNSIRCAGHAKWQNISKTKQANDLLKGRTISRYVLQVRRAIVSNNMQTDPKLNSRLAAVLAEANKFNVPKATLDRAILRAQNIQVKPCNMEIQGPQGCSIIVRCETDNKNVLRKDLRKILKKFDAALLPEDTIHNMFRSQGFVVASTKDKEGRELEYDQVEEAAIMADAHDVTSEIHEEAQDENLSKVWVFTTDADRVNVCKGELEKLGINVVSSDVDLVPYRYIDFGGDVSEKVIELTKVLREVDQVIDVHHNVELSKE